MIAIDSQSHPGYIYSTNRNNTQPLTTYFIKDIVLRHLYALFHFLLTVLEGQLSFQSCDNWCLRILKSLHSKGQKQAQFP